VTLEVALIGGVRPKFLKGSEMNTEIARNPEEIASKINEEHATAFEKAQDALPSVSTPQLLSFTRFGTLS